MCGPPYDREFGVPNLDHPYKIQVRLDRKYSYLKNHKKGETEKEYFKRIGKNADS